MIAEPLVMIRYGNAMWTPRAFDIWMCKWPKLIWGFTNYSDKAKQLVCNLGPKQIIKAVFQYRAKGVYTTTEFKKYFSDEKNRIFKFILFIIAVFPSRFANFLSVIYVLKNRSNILAIYDLSLCRNASWLSRFLSRKL